MALKLPVNVLTYIATFVEKEDRITCAQVCKHWTESFLNAYWGKLDINESIINHICDILYCKQSYIKNSHRVWALVLDELSLEHSKNLPDLQRIYPEISYLEYIEILEKANSITETINWEAWRSLSHLKIAFVHRKEQFDFENIIMKLSKLPSLVHLSLRRSPSKIYPFNISWNDFELLHHHLPLLKYLKLGFNFAPVPIDDQESMRRTRPAYAINSFKYPDNYTDTLWILYFALKYPNLKSFLVDPDNIDQITRTTHETQQYQNELQTLSNLDQFFPCLKKATTPTVSCNGWSYNLFYETLRHFGTRIDHVELRLYNALSTFDSAPNCISLVSESLKTMKIKRRFYIINLEQKTLAILNLCPRLVKLDIHVRKDMIEIDNILNHCPVLLSLTFNTCMVSLSENTHDSHNIHIPHPLQRLDIGDASVNAHVFTYLSLRCHQLVYLKMFGIGIPYTNFEETGQLFINMFMTQLDTLILSDIGSQSSISEEPIYIRHCVVEQMNNSNIRPLGESSQTQKPQINWYHICMDRTNKMERTLIWKLGKKEVGFSQKYLKDFKRRKLRQRGRKDMEKIWDAYVLKRFWKKDLENGVLILRFKSVNKYFLGVR
ncbi:hypothetical protein CLU79DRAFT_770111 [Phycomyces nitens]|nr:hypothetical protein CLU79DRAFT_770111 [Phycomyces nitens]